MGDDGSDSDERPEDGERLWNRFENGERHTDSGSDTLRSEADADGDSGRAGPSPPPPTVDERTEDADVPPGPSHRNIREMQPLYKRRPAEFYLLWLIAALSYGLGDMVTTSVVFVTPRVGESNPLVALVLDQLGLAGFVGAKLVIFGLLLAIGVKGAIDDDRLSYYGPPVLAILVGTVLTAWNLKAILGL